MPDRKKKINNVIQENWAIPTAVLFLIIVALTLFFSNAVKQHISGEAFYDFYFADQYPWQESWKVFFYERVLARFMHGVTITGLYKVIGYSPPGIYLSLIFVEIATAAFFALSLADLVRKKWHLFLVTITFALLPLNLHNILFLKPLHHAFAWLFFWICIFFTSRWVKNGALYELALGTLAGLISVLYYEAFILAFPVAVLLNLKSISNLSEFVKKTAVTVVMSIGAIIMVFMLEAGKLSGRLFELFINLGSQSAGLISRIINGLSGLFNQVWNDGLLMPKYYPSLWETWLARLIFIAGTLFSLYLFIAFFLHIRKSKKSREAIVNLDQIALLSSAFFLGISIFVPYIMSTPERSVDTLVGVENGVLLILLALVITLQRKGKEVLANFLLIGFCAFWIWVGSNHYEQAVGTDERFGVRLGNFVESITQEIPQIKENTTFIFVNAGFGRTGCIGLMNMIYGQRKLHCIHLFDGDTEEMYTREEWGLLEDTGRSFKPDFIILTLDGDGRAILIDEITPLSLPKVPIDWIVTAPIELNRDRIIKTQSPSSPLYFYEISLMQKNP